MTIGGSAVFAAFSVAGGSATDLGSGAAVAASVLSRPNPPFCIGTATCYNFFLLRFRPGADLHLAADRLERAVTKAGCPTGLCLVTSRQQPADIQNYRGVRDTPFVLGAALGLLAVGTLSHVLFTAVFRRRRDLAVLKALGMRRSQLMRVVSWQASALAATAVLIGVPAGAVAGRWPWAPFAGSVGTPRAPISRPGRPGHRPLHLPSRQPHCGDPRLDGGAKQAGGGAARRVRRATMTPVASRTGAASTTVVVIAAPLTGNL
jgi:hypothetical protein